MLARKKNSLDKFGSTFLFVTSSWFFSQKKNCRQPLLDLKPAISRVIHLNFTKEEKDFYDALESRANTQFDQVSLLSYFHAFFFSKFFPLSEEQNPEYFFLVCCRRNSFISIHACSRSPSKIETVL